jgi:general secretion pathway protein M
MNSPNAWQQFRQAGQQLWRQRSPREQMLLRWGAWLVLAVSLWQWALAPALRTWHQAPTRQAALDLQTQRMRQLQAQAQSLQKPASVSRTEAVQWLEKNLSELGPNAQISLQGDSATLRVEAAPAWAMARWLSQARDSTQALPLQAQMQHHSQSTSQEVLWQGTVVLRLP